MRLYIGLYRFYLHILWLWSFLCRSHYIRCVYTFRSLVVSFGFVLFFLRSFFSLHFFFFFLSRISTWSFGSSKLLSQRRNIIHIWKAWHTQTRMQAPVTAWLHLMSASNEYPSQTKPKEWARVTRLWNCRHTTRFTIATATETAIVIAIRIAFIRDHFVFSFIFHHFDGSRTHTGNYLFYSILMVWCLFIGGVFFLLLIWMMIIIALVSAAAVA